MTSPGNVGSKTLVSASALALLSGLAVAACASDDASLPIGALTSSSSGGGAGAPSGAGTSGTSTSTPFFGSGGSGTSIGFGTGAGSGGVSGADASGGGGSGSSGAGMSSGGSASGTDVGGTDAGGTLGSGGSAPAGCGKSTGTEPLIDDLEDGNTNAALVDGRSGVWETFDDSTLGGSFDPRAPTATQGRNASVGYCVSVSGYKQWGADLVVNMGSPKCSYDASAYKGVCFWARGKLDAGGPVEFSVATADTDPVTSGGACEANCNSHYRLKLTGDSALTEQYKQYCVEWAKLDLPRVPAPKPLDAKAIVHMEWKFPAGAGASTDGTLCVDDVSFMK